MASEVDICNLALIKLGADRIVSLDDAGSPNAAWCKAVYALQRDAELRKHPWSFAVRRAELATVVAGPLFGPVNAFELPADYVRLLPHNAARDWQIEGRQITTDDGAPLEIRYVARITDTSLFDALFVEALACRIAVVLCEPITQSNSKVEAKKSEYRDAIWDARRANAFERVSDELPEDDWILARF